MLPDDVVEFLHGPRSLALGTRSSKLRPAMARVVGCYGDAATDQISVFLPNVQREPHLTNLADNGMVALTVGEPRTHKNYQFKGRVVEIRPSTASDAAIRELSRDKLAAFFRQQYFVPLPDSFIGGYISDPSTTIVFRVLKIFNQTPGPNAGRPIDFIPTEA